MVIYLVFLLIVLCFGFVLLFGAPYLPTHKNQSKIALEMLDLKKGQTLYELGCGDGTVLLLAAKKGIKSVGYELNPILYLVAKIRCWRYRKSITIRFGNFWGANLSGADAVYVFLLNKFMSKLDGKLSAELKAETKLASYTFKIPGKRIIKEESGVFLYKY